MYASLRQRKERPSGPAAFLGAEVKIAFHISVSVTDVQGSACVFQVEVGGWNFGGVGNMTVLNRFAFSMKVDVVIPL